MEVSIGGQEQAHWPCEVSVKVTSSSTPKKREEVSLCREEGRKERKKVAQVLAGKRWRWGREGTESRCRKEKQGEGAGHQIGRHEWK